ncbi:CopD family protein [Marinobacter sp. M216]|uniref:CopD family protein n=1 Tax=Marinobacter albus TaxID=3030833 RepID=A0ABT7HFR7_9GAMM|nr:MULTISPECIES: CopD family protein [unclassified Marinobacter]MBW7472670.1 CopD family protein [Marinobacter sp. F4218]MDK9559223.1 CopD family protein [Marinobacter sp. M216]
MSLAIALHVLSAVVWVGGMFFAYMAMRPAVIEVVEASQRGTLWCRTLSRFFRWVWLAIILLLVTGYWMVFSVFGGMAGAGWHIHAMQGLGLIMMLLFFHVYFAPFRRLKQAVAEKDPQEGGRRVGQIRRLVGINLILGLVVIVVGAGGRYL